jgi:hypothetical protein
MHSTSCYCQIVMKLEIILTDFKKILNIKFCENASIKNPVFPCRRTDSRHDEANSCFCNFANAPQKWFFSDDGPGMKTYWKPIRT